MRDEDAGEVFRRAPDGGEALANLAQAEAGIHQGRGILRQIPPQNRAPEPGDQFVAHPPAEGRRPARAACQIQNVRHRAHTKDFAKRSAAGSMP